MLKDSWLGVTQMDMTKRYFNWLQHKLLKCDAFDPYRYSCLFEHLFATPFTYINTMDVNREADGKNLREFFVEHDKTFFKTPELREVFLLGLPPRTTVLEMMGALAIRCSSEVMVGLPGNYSPGDIFWTMIENLGLDKFPDDEYSENEVRRIIDRMLHGRIKRSGEGGMFQIKNPNYDMRTAEYWYQMQWWASEIYEAWKQSLPSF